MKKRKNLDLDFTSLLDVILIILFIVIGSTSVASVKAEQELVADLAEAQTKIYDLEQEQVGLQNELDRTKAELAIVKTETKYNPGSTDNTVDLLKGITKIVLDSSTTVDPITKDPSVQICISAIRSGGNQEDMGTVSFLHNLALSGADRERLCSEQVHELANVLIDGLKDDPIPVFWLTIQFMYNDENFTKSDIESIHQAVNTAQLQLGKTFYTDEYHKN